ncbi:MAG: hypothetical protein ACI9K2_001417 [Myxococcota bacterium]|jgi:hypothetical protein
MRLLPLILALGCTDPGSRDGDGDGVPAARDCDDDDPRSAPGLDEVPYDGRDNDCRDGDLLDVDGDGWPGVARADYPGRWPANAPDAMDCADDPAARPDAAEIHPGAPDSAYDGIDHDCAGDDDYDADGDGHGPAVLPDGSSTGPAREDYLQAWSLDLPALPLDDCDDADPATYAGAPDAPYDAHDADCALDDDYDADGDGWLPDEATWAGPRSRWIRQAFGGLPPFGTKWGDCLDQPDLGAAPEAVHPGAADPPYDGVDGDCAGDQDYDADMDGYIREGDDAAAEAFDARWGGTADWRPGDCNDGDATVSPAAAEVLGDGIDADCDGSDGSSRLHLDDVPWSGLSTLTVAATDDLLVLGAVATDRAGAGPAVYLVALDRWAPGRWLDTSAVFGEGPMEPALALLGGGQRLDVISAWTDGITVLAATRLLRDGDGWSELRREEAFFGLEAFALTDIDAALVDEAVTAWACGPDAVVVLDTDDGPALDPAALRVDVGGDHCFAEPGDPGRGTVCDVAGCTTFDHDPVWAEIRESEVQPWSDRTPADADQRGDWVILAEPGIGVSLIGEDTSFVVFEGEEVLAADGAVLGDDLYVAAVVLGPDGPTVRALFGPADSLFDVTIDTDGRSPVGVAVQPLPDQDAVLVGLALAGMGPGDDRVAWSVLGL